MTLSLKQLIAALLLWGLSVGLSGSLGNLGGWLFGRLFASHPGLEDVAAVMVVGVVVVFAGACAVVYLPAWAWKVVAWVAVAGLGVVLVSSAAAGLADLPSWSPAIDITINLQAVGDLVRYDLPRVVGTVIGGVSGVLQAAEEAGVNIGWAVAATLGPVLLLQGLSLSRRRPGQHRAAAL